MSYIQADFSPTFPKYMVQVSAVKEGGTNLGGRLFTYKSECLLFLEVFLRSGGGQKEMTTFFFF